MVCLDFQKKISEAEETERIVAVAAPALIRDESSVLGHAVVELQDPLMPPMHVVNVFFHSTCPPYLVPFGLQIKFKKCDRTPSTK